MLKKGGSSEIEGYSEAGPGSEITAGGRRRRRSLRRKGARKGSRKRSRRHYGGNSQQQQQKQQQKQQQQQQEQQEQEQQQGGEEEMQVEAGEHVSTGGSRRRKGRRGKKTRGKKTSPWIKHVFQFAKDHNMKYFQALKDKRCRAAYKSSK